MQQVTFRRVFPKMESLRNITIAKISRITYERKHILNLLHWMLSNDQRKIKKLNWDRSLIQDVIMNIWKDKRHGFSVLVQTTARWWIISVYYNPNGYEKSKDVRKNRVANTKMKMG